MGVSKRQDGSIFSRDFETRAEPSFNIEIFPIVAGFSVMGVGLLAGDVGPAM